MHSVGDLPGSQLPEIPLLDEASACAPMRNRVFATGLEPRRLPRNGMPPQRGPVPPKRPSTEGGEDRERMPIASDSSSNGGFSTPVSNRYFTTPTAADLPPFPKLPFAPSADARNDAAPGRAMLRPRLRPTPHSPKSISVASIAQDQEGDAPPSIERVVLPRALFLPPI